MKLQITTTTIAGLLVLLSSTDAYIGPSRQYRSLFFSNPAELLFQQQKEVKNQIYSSINQECFSPKYEITSDEDRFRVTMDVPGVKPDDVDISVEENTLTLRAERKLESETSVFNSKFYKSFTIDPATDVSKINANLANGVLSVTVPKVKLEKIVTKIPVSVNEADVPIGMVSVQESGDKTTEDESPKANSAEAKQEADDVAK
mmetsp:Transcript_30467/g.46654  ORF Transcript_30467/g.46654 Transcript_30467/m.46654 type:complete len:203 (+) Transcript_30467:80-688(+)